MNIQTNIITILAVLMVNFYSVEGGVVEGGANEGGLRGVIKGGIVVEGGVGEEGGV